MTTYRNNLSANPRQISYILYQLYKNASPVYPTIKELLNRVDKGNREGVDMSRNNVSEGLKRASHSDVQDIIQFIKDGDANGLLIMFSKLTIKLTQIEIIKPKMPIK